MKIKTSELSGKALDYAVGLADNRMSFTDYSFHIGAMNMNDLLDEASNYMEVERYWTAEDIRSELLQRHRWYDPSTDWTLGGPIIEENLLWINHSPLDAEEAEWMAMAFPYDDNCSSHYGPTVLIAAMRCFVGARLGIEVDIPKELS